MPSLPGISDQERLEELRDRLLYAVQDLSDAQKAYEEAEKARDLAMSKYVKADLDHKRHLEAMAAGVTK